MPTPESSVSSGPEISPAPTKCLNCGKEPLASKYCPDCGQENHPSGVPLRVLLHDVGEEFLKWDGRLLRTLGALLIPGRLTNAYNAGRRQHFLSPYKTYFVVTTLFFLILSWQGPFKSNELNTNLQDGFKAGLVDKQDKDKPSVPLINGKALLPADLKVNGKPIEQGDYLKAFDKWQKDTRNKEKLTGFELLVARQMLKMTDSPEGFLSQFVQSLAKAIFFLVPIHALLLMLLFRKTKRYYVDHLVFSVNTHSVAFLMLAIADLFPDSFFLIAIGLGLSYYLHELVALRAVYGLSLGKTIFYQIILNTTYGWAIFLGLALTALVTIALL
jgi:hypothetical protein